MNAEIESQREALRLQQETLAKPSDPVEATTDESVSLTIASDGQLPDAPTYAISLASFIDIVFDGPPGPTSGRFVEVENEQGVSIHVGEWIERGDGLWALRIPR